MTVDGQRYVVGGVPGSDWAANARAAGEATLHQGRRAERVRMVEMSVEEARPLLRVLPVGVSSAGPHGLTDITYHRHVIDGKPQPTVRVAFDRPEVRNAFRPHTVDELYRVLDHARMSPDVGVILL